MANMFDSFKDSINKGVATVSVKSGSLKEKTLIKTAISNAQKQMASELNELGVRFYNTWAAARRLRPAAASSAPTAARPCLRAAASATSAVPP